MLPEGGTVTITSQTCTMNLEETQASPFDLSPGDFLSIQVSDTGHGIPDSDLSKIFDPFFTTKEHTEGTGLGLAAVFGIMQSHNGAISVSSQMDQGTTFTMKIPLSQQPLDTEYERAVPSYCSMA